MAAATLGARQSPRTAKRVAVVGAGAFGGWTALHLLRSGARVTLVDPWGPGNARASSGGESRVIRYGYGSDHVYVELVVRALELWRENEAKWRLGPRIRATRQEIYYFGPPPGENRYDDGVFPCWMSPTSGVPNEPVYYGIPGNRYRQGEGRPLFLVQSLLMNHSKRATTGYRRHVMRRFMLVMFLAAASASAQDQATKATEGWIQLPSEGETSASAFAVVQNPTMYDVYLVSAASEVAGKVELREGSDAEPKEPVVAAYGKLTMKPDGAHIVLLDLKRPLEEGESIPITITTDSSLKIRFNAVVRKE